MHFKRQQVRKAMDMRRMIAQLTMEAITATLKPKVSWGIMAVRETRPAPRHCPDPEPDALPTLSEPCSIGEAGRCRQLS